MKSARIQAGEKSRKNYLGLLNGDIKKAFGGRTLAQTATCNKPSSTRRPRDGRS